MTAADRRLPLDRVCPDCETTLAADATYCGCGWKEANPAAAALPRVQCTDCPRPSLVLSREDGKPRCTRCDDRQHLVAATERCRALGLNTTDEMRAYVREKMRALKRKWEGVPEREPGSDDE